MTKEVQRSESEASKHAGRPAHASFSTFHCSFQRYTFVDYATQVYIALVGLIILLLYSPRVPLWPFLLLAHAVGLLPAFYLLASNYVLLLHVPEPNFHLNPLSSFVRSALHYEFETLREYHGPRDDLPTFRASQRPLDSIIYVIDESVRGSNLSLNGYPRPTTPFLQSFETRGRLKNLGICVAAGSFSHISNAYLVTGHNAFPDDAFQTAKNPTLFDYAKKMGYETIYIDIDNGYLFPLRQAAREGPVRSLDRWMTEQSFKERHIDLETMKDLGVPMSLRVCPYDKSIFSLTAEDNRVRYYMTGSLHGFNGNSVVKSIPTPPDVGWGVSRPVGNGPQSE
jgi:hypothetical protein